MFFDAHVHSRVSPDSETDPAQVIKTLAKQGLGVCFTEHVDYVAPREGRDDTASDIPQGTRDFIADLSAYPAAYQAFKSDSVGLGLEIGLCAAYLALNRQTAAMEGLDYIIGSIHFVDGWDVYIDYFHQPFEDHYRRVLTYTREMIELNDFFDSLGHIDYISRYSPLDEKNVLYERYRDEYDAVFAALIERGKALEINTSRFGDAKAEANLLRLYKRYKEMGGSYVTIGTDAHHLGRLGRYHARAQRMAREVGLKPVYFVNRQLFYC